MELYITSTLFDTETAQNTQKLDLSVDRLPLCFFNIVFNIETAFAVHAGLGKIVVFWVPIEKFVWNPLPNYGGGYGFRCLETRISYRIYCSPFQLIAQPCRWLLGWF